MRVNIYAEEMTDRIEIISKEIEGHAYTGLRLYLELPVTLPDGTQAAGPFMHHPGDDDSAAITFWGKRDLRAVLRKMLAQLDEHYGQSAANEPVCWWVTWNADDAGVAPIRAGLYMFESRREAEVYVSKVMAMAMHDAKRPEIVPLYRIPVVAQTPCDAAVTLSGAQLLDALDFIAPDRFTDPEQLESEASIQHGDGHSGRGYYCAFADYREEGSILLDGSFGVARPSMPSTWTRQRLLDVAFGLEHNVKTACDDAAQLLRSIAPSFASPADGRARREVSHD